MKLLRNILLRWLLKDGLPAPIRIGSNTITISKDLDMGFGAIKNVASGTFEGDWIRDGTITTPKLVLPLDPRAFMFAPKKVAEITLDADATTITVTGLDILTDKFYEILLITTNPVATGGIRMFINADTTTTNYYTQLLIAEGSGVGAIRYNDTSPFHSATRVGEIGWGILALPSPLPNFPTMLSIPSLHTPPLVRLDVRMLKHNVMQSNITRLDFVHSSPGGFGAGTKLLIYGASG